jgi:hypothetical protein
MQSADVHIPAAVKTQASVPALTTPVTQVTHAADIAWLQEFA